MKNPLCRRSSSGFTLVELLVVIAIIAVLASAGFAAGNAAINKARRTTAQATAVGLETAINNFYSEYGYLPSSGATAPNSDTTVTTDSNGLLNVLLGLESGSNLQNPRKVKFLNVKEGKNNKGGLIYTGTGGTNVSGLYDPWGNPFSVTIDYDYNENIVVNLPSGVTPASVTMNGRRAAAFSRGVPPGDAVSTSTLVKTW